MPIVPPPIISLLLLLGLLAAAFSVFARVRLDYELRGKLSRPIAILQTSYFCLYALSSYVFLDSRLSHVAVAGPLLGLAIVLMLGGVTIVALSMPFLGRQSFGSEVGKLRTTGAYRLSRNPQLVGGFLFILGYAVMWPSWSGAAWAGLWLPVSHLMVRAEEAHLQAVFGAEFLAYCARTPRFIGLPGGRARL